MPTRVGACRHVEHAGWRYWARADMKTHSGRRRHVAPQWISARVAEAAVWGADSELEADVETASRSMESIWAACLGDGEEPASPRWDAVGDDTWASDSEHEVNGYGRYAWRKGKGVAKDFDIIRRPRAVIALSDDEEDDWEWVDKTAQRKRSYAKVVKGGGG
ncbi:hypothetical protein PUNSTDRAFT_141610 [Punctularia strigosozonata HHB-11173 SS5]|uniref:uncharacterized protein n=1 Tax=Punctularia strigosozonata (strain HHB-11173) TaxID=741275 RepID=UPI00044174AF|nr:uncharacterized protein PUNSTDRAFT_141610 [Punctularia strigosozonata HHB-11173 SS5]EIN11152.1 hypothetical protein PUNSTDRAFT_141610 [Punctularia strigosozonata HHB-11173 SS5]